MGKLIKNDSFSISAEVNRLLLHREYAYSFHKKIKTEEEKLFYRPVYVVFGGYCVVLVFCFLWHSIGWRIDIASHYLPINRVVSLMWLLAFNCCVCANVAKKLFLKFTSCTTYGNYAIKHLSKIKFVVERYGFVVSMAVAYSIPWFCILVISSLFLIKYSWFAAYSASTIITFFIWVFISLFFYMIPNHQFERYKKILYEFNNDIAKLTSKFSKEQFEIETKIIEQLIIDMSRTTIAFAISGSGIFWFLADKFSNELKYVLILANSGVDPFLTIMVSVSLMLILLFYAFLVANLSVINQYTVVKNLILIAKNDFS